ncbi:MAG: penicillin-binding protein 1B [Desulfobacterales bacterium]|nr:penicillin-binding protein 1B [Desulfobacterales bacterium]
MKKRHLFILLLALTAAGVFSGYTYTFNRMVRDRFQGRLWELPAQVYARPMEIYPGMVLYPGRFEKELALMGYRKETGRETPDTPGTYLRKGDQFTLFCRPFDFGDEKRSQRLTKILIKGNKVVRVKSSGRERNTERLDPVLVGMFYPSSMEDRRLITLDQTPDLLKKTIVAVEDRNFYTHYGIDPKSIFRAMAVNLKNRRLSQGASTLTQQLAKNFFLTPEKTLGRKINEAFMAAALEFQFSKEEILEAYLNEVYLGQDGKRAIHGFGLASDFYFGKPIHRLLPHETALLVGMLKGPSAFNPRRYPERAKTRRNTVLAMMAEQGLISPSLLETSRAATLGVIKKPALALSPFPYYLDLVKKRLLTTYREEDLRTMGLRIFTPLDPQVQLGAEQGLTEFLQGGSRRLEAGIVVTSRASNEIQALIGGKDFRYMGFNRAVDAIRPIGSLAKPAVFLTALMQPEKYTPVTPLSDAAITYKNPDDGSLWKPGNFDNRFHGTVPLYRALVRSYNASTVRLGLSLGLDAVSRTFGRLGHTPPSPALPSHLLGSFSMSPVQVAQVYHTLASGGFHTPARAIRTVYTPGGIRLQQYPLTIEQRFDPGPVFLLNKILQAAVTQGTGKSLKRWDTRNLGIAGKTGTTNDLRDSWFAGFSGNRLAVVWLGRDDNRPAGLTGATGALQVFGRIMAKLPNTRLNLAPPETVEWGIIDPGTGDLTGRDCGNGIAVPFIKGSKPAETTPCPQKQKVKSATEVKNRPRYLGDWLKELFK